MYQIFRTDNGKLQEQSEITDGVWINMVSPNLWESREIADHFQIDIADLRASLDEEESARVVLEDGYTLILIDIPIEEEGKHGKSYTTIPLGILIVPQGLITVCNDENMVLSWFKTHYVKEFSTKKRMRFVYQILYRTAYVYQVFLHVIDKKRKEIEDSATTKEMEDSDLLNLHELESTLVYFATSLGANKVVLDRLTRYKRLEQYPEDREILDDTIIENSQAMEMTNIYQNIIHGTRDLLTTIINNRLNNVMKFLTSITLVMAIPTIISGLYGMNVNGVGMPLAQEINGFGMICVLTTVVCVIALIILKRRKML